MKKYIWLAALPLLICLLTLTYKYWDYYYHDYYDGSRYMVSKYEGNYWLHDDVEAFTIEKDGQSLQQGKRYIYSYGKSGFVIIDKKNNTLKVLFDQQSNAFQKESFENQKALNPQYIQIITVTDLTETEKDMYTTLRNTDDGYKPSPQEEFFREWFAIPFLIQGWVSSSFGAFFLDGLIFWSLL